MKTKSKKSTKLAFMKLGERLKEARIKKGFTMVELAKAAKISQPQISNYEKGTLQPKTEILVELAKALDVTTDYLSRGTPIEKFNPFEGLSEENLARALDYINLLKRDQNSEAIKMRFEVIKTQIKDSN